MASYDLTYENGNNFENESSAVAVTAKAQIRPESGRGVSPALFIGAGDVITSGSVNANSVIGKIYLVTEEAMAGTVTVAIGGTEVFPAGTSVSSVGLAVSAIEDVYVTTPENITITFSDAQTAGQIKVAYEFISLDTNTAKYVGA